MKSNTDKALIDLQRHIYRESSATEGPLENVLPWLLDRRNLEAAWRRVRSADGAKTPGRDGLTALDVAPRKDPWLSRLANQLHRGSFRPTPPRWVDVPKSSGSNEMRRLGILNISDRVVHTAVKQILEPVLDPVFSNHSFGFRPGRSVPGALAEAIRRLSGQGLHAGSVRHGAEATNRLSGERRKLRFRCLCKLDVANCFDSIDHEHLFSRFGHFVADTDLTELVAKLLGSSATTHRFLWRRRTVGVAQGSALSPLLCNLALDGIDRLVSEQFGDDQVCLLRYADDLLLLANTRSDARRAAGFVERALRHQRMRLKHSKTEIVPAENGIRWLGVEIRPRQQNWGSQVEFAYYVADDRVARMQERIDEMTVPPSTRIDSSAFDLGRWLVSINDQLRDWWASYRFAENAGSVFRRVDEHTDTRVGNLLRSITGLRARGLAGEYRMNLPRGFRTWQVGGTRLVVLSSLAPRRPAYLTRRPLWMRARRRRHSAAVSL